MAVRCLDMAGATMPAANVAVDTKVAGMAEAAMGITDTAPMADITPVTQGVCLADKCGHPTVVMG